jgi:hypothetical protein
MVGRITDAGTAMHTTVQSLSSESGCYCTIMIVRECPQCYVSAHNHFCLRGIACVHGCLPGTFRNNQSCTITKAYFKSTAALSIRCTHQVYLLQPMCSTLLCYHTDYVAWETKRPNLGVWLLRYSTNSCPRDLVPALLLVTVLDRCTMST